MIRGTVIAFDRADGHGEISLEDGRIVRFAFHAVKDKAMNLAPGAPALVDGIDEGFGGRLRAALVRDPIEALSPAEKLSALLARPDTRGDTLRELYRSLPDEDKHRTGRALIDWTFTHAHRLGALSRVDVLSAVPLDAWSDIELAAILDDVSRGELLHFDDVVKKLMRAAKQRLAR